MARVHSGVGRLRLFVWRWQGLLALVWVALLAAVAGALWIYHTRVPASIDTGMTVALRQIAYRDTFREVERARHDAELAAASANPADRDRLRDRAVERLELFLSRHPSVQPDRLETHSVVAATELLAGIWVAEERYKRAARLLTRLARQVPNNYRLHWLAGRARADSGDLAAAASAFRAAFKLAPNHPEVAEDYLDVLSVLNSFADIVWVAEHFEGAVRRGAPAVEIKVGPARGGLQRRGLEWSGVPVEHGSYVRSVTLFEAGRGTRQVLAPPDDLLANWNHGGPLFVQLRFENVYDGLVVDAFRWWGTDGVRHELPLGEDTVATHHRAHSGVEWYVEFRTNLDPRTVAGFEVVYSVPFPELSRSAREIVDKAVANLGAWR